MAARRAQPETVVELPADGASPAAARRYLRQALHAAGHEQLLDDALLLVTELVTNAVVHAGTAVRLGVAADADGVLVEVADRSPGSTPVVRGEADGDREGGRGLFLLDALATEWGTTHDRERKAVWFRLAPEGAGAPGGAEPTLRTLGDVTDVAVEPTMDWLLALPDDLEQQLSPSQLLGELVHRLADALDVTEAVLLVESDRDPDRWEVVAARGDLPTDEHVAELRRAALTAEQAVTSGRGTTTVLLRGRGGPFGALVLGAGPLSSRAVAVARLTSERLGLVLRDDRADVAQRRQRGSLALLAEASDMFAATLDVQLAVTLATQLVVPRLAEWAAVHTVHDRGVQLASVSHADEDRTAALRVALSSTAGTEFAQRLARDLAVQRPALVGRAELAAVLGEQQHGDVLALPLVARRRLIGGLVVARPPGGSYSAEDVALLLDLARRAALAVDNARLYGERTAIAQALQASLLPPQLPVADGVEFGARYLPAGEGNEVGGDFYDVVPLDDGGWAVAIGDVCGKGAEAAAITGLARNVLRLLVRDGRTPSAALRRLNEAVLELGERGRFCTVALAVLRPTADGALDVTFSSGGHPPPVLVPGSGPAAFVPGTGTVLGVVEDPDLADTHLVLAPDDVLVLYTDGVTERRDGDRMFGEEMLLRLLAGTARRHPDAVAGVVERAVRDFGDQTSRDDLAVLAVRAAPSSARVPVARDVLTRRA